MENGDRARLDNLEHEVQRLRDWKHDRVAQMLQAHEAEIGVLKLAVSMLQSSSGKTSGLLDRWKDMAIALLAAGLLVMLLRFGIPKL